MFDRKPLRVRVNDRKEGELSDEREILLHKLINENPQFKVLEGAELYTEFDYRAKPFIWYRTKITPFKLCIKEGK